MAKTLEIGNVIVKKKDDGTFNRFLALGKKSKDPKYNKYDLSVEVIVRDAKGTVVSRQTDGFISLQDPRTAGQELLSKGIINEEAAATMNERAAKIPESIKFTLQMSNK